MEYLLLWIVYGILILLSVILGIFLWRGKGAFLIAGYNTAKPSERAKYNEKALCRSVAVILFAIALSFIVSAFGIVYDEIIPPWLGFVLILVVALIGIIYINTSKKVKRK